MSTRIETRTTPAKTNGTTAIGTIVWSDQPNEFTETFVEIPGNESRPVFKMTVAHPTNLDRMYRIILTQGGRTSHHSRSGKWTLAEVLASFGIEEVAND